MTIEQLFGNKCCKNRKTIKLVNISFSQVILWCNFILKFSRHPFVFIIPTLRRLASLGL